MARLLQALLFGVTAHDPLVFAGDAVLLVGVATAAGVLPALRATRVSPLIAPRAEWMASEVRTKRPEREGGPAVPPAGSGRDLAATRWECTSR